MLAFYRDSEACVPLHDACKKGHVSVMKVLLELNAFQDKRNVMGQTCAHFAATGGHVQVLRFLYEMGADFGATDGNKQTPAHCAAKARKLACMRELAELGADFGTVDRDGKTVLDIAASYLRLHRSYFLSLETIKLLFEYGAVLTIGIVASMIAERDEAVLSSNLRATRSALQHGVVYSKNPIMAALTIAAAFRARALSAQTISGDLTETGHMFALVATTLMGSDSLDDEQTAMELLTAPEKGHEVQLYYCTIARAAIAPLLTMCAPASLATHPTPLLSIH
jgi:hypothetical protein